jgi:hypothetical protein
VRGTRIRTSVARRLGRISVKYLRVWNSVFALDKLEGVRSGDYWQFVSRNGALDIDNAQLKRPLRVFAPLALVRKHADGSLVVLDRFQRVVGVPWREVDESLDIGG